MPVSVRYFLFPEGSDPLRLSQRLVDGLTQGKDTMPQYADTKRRVMGVVVQNEDGKPTNLDRNYGTIWTFDEDGCDHEPTMGWSNPEGLRVHVPAELAEIPYVFDSACGFGGSGDRLARAMLRQLRGDREHVGTVIIL